MKDYSPLNVFSDQQEVKHQGQTGWIHKTVFATLSVACVGPWTGVFCSSVCVCALLKSTLFFPWCYLVLLSQSQSSTTGDKICLLWRQEEMELGSLERASHNCIFIILEGSSAMLNSWALISDMMCLHRGSCVCLASSPWRQKQKKSLPFIAGVINRLTC